MAIHSYTQLYIAIHAIHSYTWLYTAIHGYTWLYMAIHGNTQIFYYDLELPKCRTNYIRIHSFTVAITAIHAIPRYLKEDTWL